MEERQSQGEDQQGTENSGCLRVPNLLKHASS
jgi:hypothetical protein